MKNYPRRQRKIILDQQPKYTNLGRYKNHSLAKSEHKPNIHPEGHRKKISVTTVEIDNGQYPCLETSRNIAVMNFYNFETAPSINITNQKQKLCRSIYGQRNATFLRTKKIFSPTGTRFQREIMTKMHTLQMDWTLILLTFHTVHNIPHLTSDVLKRKIQNMELTANPPPPKKNVITPMIDHN